MKDLQSDVLGIAHQEKALVTKKEGLNIVTVENPQEGLKVAKKILYEVCNKETALFLSGGNTPKPLYETLADEKRLSVGAVAMVDERFGPRFHEHSNELMIRETGLLDYLKSSGIPFYPILDDSAKIHPNGVVLRDKHLENREWFALKYKQRVIGLLRQFSSVALLGVGEDGHTAGIPPLREDFIEPLVIFDNYNVKDRETYLVFPFRDPKNMKEGGFGERITLAFGALEMMNFLIVLAFGSAKQNAIKQIFERGPLKEIPARFYTQKNIAPKTLLITDQKI